MSVQRRFRTNCPYRCTIAARVEEIDSQTLSLHHSGYGEVQKREGDTCLRILFQITDIDATEVVRDICRTLLTETYSPGLKQAKLDIQSMNHQTRVVTIQSKTEQPQRDGLLLDHNFVLELNSGLEVTVQLTKTEIDSYCQVKEEWYDKGASFVKREGGAEYLISFVIVDINKETILREVKNKLQTTNVRLAGWLGN